MQKNNRPKNILVARFSALGDVAMTLPSVYNACYANPGTQFYFLSRYHPAQVFINHPDNLTIVPVNLDNFKGAAGLRRLAKARQKLGVSSPSSLIMSRPLTSYLVIKPF